MFGTLAQSTVSWQVLAIRAFQVRSPRLRTLIPQILIKLDGMVALKKLSKCAKFFWSVTTRCQYRRGQSFDKRTKCISFERPYLSIWLFNNRNFGIIGLRRLWAFKWTQTRWVKIKKKFLNNFVVCFLYFHRMRGWKSKKNFLQNIL